MNQIQVRAIDGITYVQNERYPRAVNCFDKSVIPNIGVEYAYLQWAEPNWSDNFYVDMNNYRFSFSEEQLATIQNICINWVQPIGQEGNYTPEQIRFQELQRQILEAKGYLSATDFKMIPNYVPKAGEDLVAVIQKRDEQRQFIRDNELVLNELEATILAMQLSTS